MESLIGSASDGFEIWIACTQETIQAGDDALDDRRFHLPDLMISIYRRDSGIMCKDRFYALCYLGKMPVLQIVAFLGECRGHRGDRVGSKYH